METWKSCKDSGCIRWTAYRENNFLNEELGKIFPCSNWILSVRPEWDSIEEKNMIWIPRKRWEKDTNHWYSYKKKKHRRLWNISCKVHWKGNGRKCSFGKSCQFDSSEWKDRKSPCWRSSGECWNWMLHKIWRWYICMERIMKASVPQTRSPQIKALLPDIKNNHACHHSTDNRS